VRRMRAAGAALGALLMLVGVAGSVQGDGQAAAREPIDRVLDAFHDAAKKADGKRYFDQLAPDAVFLGTDATERWTRDAFEAFAMPHFEAGRGWAYTSTARHVDLEAGGELAWFDELLENESYGTCRGSGVLRKREGRWRIAQYNLSIAVPNPVARDVVARIRAHEDGRTSSAVVYLVRHAEKGQGLDPELTAEGRARACALARVLRSAGLDRVYATEYRRTRETVAPTAACLKLAVTPYAAARTKELAETLRTDASSRAALVAGHSNTLPGLLARLGVKAAIGIGARDHDDLFVVTLRPGEAPRFQHLHYGR